MRDRRSTVRGGREDNLQVLSDSRVGGREGGREEELGREGKMAMVEK